MSGRLIAVVEDEYTKKSQLKTLLEKAGYKVSSFAASQNLISELASISPSIIITDKDPANAKNPFWIMEHIKKEPRLKNSEIFAYLKEIEVKDEISLRKFKITSYFTKTNKINYIVEGVGKHFALASLPKEFDPWADHLERQQSYQSPPPGYHTPPAGQQKPAQGHPASAPQASAQAPRPPAAAAPAQQKPAQAPQAQAQRGPLIPTPASGARPAPAKPEGMVDFSDFLTTIGDSVVKKDEEKKSPPVSPALDNFNKGMEFFNKEQFPQALIMFEKSRLDKMLQARSLVMIGKIHRHMNNLNAAIATFKEAHHSADDTETKLDSRYEIALTMKAQGKLQDAYNMLATVYKTDKNFKDVRNKLIELKGMIK